MTDISVIKMIISVAVWRIYPSWVNDKLWAWEGLGHFGMFWARLSGDDFRSKLEIISFLSRVMFISKSFLFPALLQNLAPNVRALGLLVSTMSWSSFCKLRSVTGPFLWTPTTTTSIFWIFLFFFQAELVLLACQLWWSPGWAKLFGGGSSKTRMETWFPALAWSSAEAWEGPSIVVAFSTSLRVACGDPWSKRDKSPTKSACDYPSSSTKTSEETNEFWGACFRDPM